MVKPLTYCESCEGIGYLLLITLVTFVTSNSLVLFPI